MKTKFTKRDLKFFLLGAVVMLFISLILDWESAKSGFTNGWNSVK